ncbi:hypothetical protein [Bartonella sp. LJL80]
MASDVPEFIQATAVTKVFGDGVRFVAVAIEARNELASSDILSCDFIVDQRTVTEVFISRRRDPSAKAETGRFVIVELSADDAAAKLKEDGKAKPPQNGNKASGMGMAGSVVDSGTSFKQAEAVVFWNEDCENPAKSHSTKQQRSIKTTEVENLIVDDFKQFTFNDPQNGNLLAYNLYFPAHYDDGKSYPIVLFMHDAGVTGKETKTTLFQGLGAVCWASPADQAKRPCFVLAPQYDCIIADDNSNTASVVDSTINLIKDLTRHYNIDRNRIYATGQSGGCMAAIALNIKYPNFFAASFLVAGQWDPALVKPLSSDKLWVVVSEDDSKAFPGQNAIMSVLRAQGAHIAVDEWDAHWSPEQFRVAYDAIRLQDAPINYIIFKKGTVIPAGESSQGASGHRNTWRVAYTIEPIREWLFNQEN